MTFRLQYGIMLRMIDKTKERKIPEHFTSTVELVEKFEASTNPVTKAVYRSMIAARIGITEQQEVIKRGNMYSARKYLDGCTFSFDGRKRMETLFDFWYMK